MQRTPPRTWRMFALSLAAACAVTIADVREVEGSELPGLPQVPEIKIPSLPKVPELQPAPQLELPDRPPLPSAPPPVQAPKPSLPGPRSTPDVPAGGAPPSSTGNARTPAGGSTPQAGSRAGAAARVDEEDGKTRRAATRKQRAAARRERRLRRVVKELWACSYAVRGFERQVLIRRVGIDGYSPDSSTAVARALQVSVKRIRRAQRSGLRRLRAANRSDRCAMSSPPAAVVQTVGAIRAAATAPALVPAERVALANGPSSPASEDDGEGAVLGERRASTPVHTERPRIAGTLATAATDDGSEPWLLILLLALTAVAAATPLLLRRRQQSSPAPQAHPDPAPPPAPRAEPPQPSRWVAPPPWAEPEPRPDQTAPPREVQHGQRRATGIGLSAVASLALTWMMRARRRR